MESPAAPATFAQLAQVTMQAVNLRLRDRVPFVEYGEETSIVDVLHRLTRADQLSLARTHQLALLLIEVSGNTISRTWALDLMAQTLGYKRYHGAEKAAVKHCIPNLKKARRKAHRKEVVREQ